MQHLVKFKCDFSWQVQGFGGSSDTFRGRCRTSEVQVTLFVAGAALGEVQVSLFVAVAALGHIRVPFRGKCNTW